MADTCGLTDAQYQLHYEYTRGGRSAEQRAAHSLFNSAWKRKHRAANTSSAGRIRNREREYKNLRADTGAGYRALWLNSVKLRARRKGLPFNITLDDLHFPDVCPVLGIPIKARSGAFSDSSPSIDRIIPALGYVKGNVQIMLYRANRIKCHASLDELRKIVAFMERELQM